MVQPTGNIATTYGKNLLSLGIAAGKKGRWETVRGLLFMPPCRVGAEKVRVRAPSPPTATHQGVWGSPYLD